MIVANGFSLDDRADRRMGEAALQAKTPVHNPIGRS
jgi:hypothetical protein